MKGLLRTYGLLVIYFISGISMVIYFGVQVRQIYKHKTLMDSLTIEKLKLEIELKKLHLKKQ